MYIVLTIALCLFSFSFHELGHAWAAYTLRVPIRTISLLGMKFPFLPSLSWWIRIPHQWRPVRVQIHPLLIGAYVSHEQHAFKALPTRDQAFLYGAGPYASLLYSIMMWTMGCLTHPQDFIWRTWALSLGLIFLMIVFRRFICRYGVLAVGLLVFGLLFYSLLTHFDKTVGSFGGPVTIAHQSSQEYTKQAVQHYELRTAFNLAASLSLAVGLTNALPLVPLDGGHMMRVYLTKLNARAGRISSVVTGLLFLIIVSMALSGDFRIAFKGLFG